MSHPNGKSACPDKEPALGQLLFGELKGEERAEMGRHLEICPRCRQAFADARRGLAALSTLKEAPLPYTVHETASGEPTHPEVAWVDFQRKLRSARSEKESVLGTASGAWWFRRVAAAAALLTLGFGLGRWGTAPSRGATSPSTENASLEELQVDARAVAALTRAELLSDVGFRYVNGLQDLLQSVMDASAAEVPAADLTSTRETAIELIRDGRLLRRSLDPERDKAFLATIDRAEVFLEDIAAVESDPAGTGVRILQATLRGSRLLYQLATLNLQKEVDIALETSGWIGEELVQRKEF